MLTQSELSKLERALRGTHVLSVYLDGRVSDPAERTAWRRRLSDALDELRDAARSASHTERADLEGAIVHLEERLSAFHGLRAPGWVGFATSDGVRYAEALPAAVPPVVAWGEGARTAPYLVALEQHHRVAVAVVDARSARLYVERDGRLEPEGELHAEVVVGPVSHMGQPPLQGFHAGTRGASATDEAERARLTGRDRMLGEVGERLAALAGTDGWIVVGGIPEVAAAAVRALPDAVRRRARAVSGLDVHATEAQIAAYAARAAGELRTAATAAAVDEVLDRHAAGGRAIVGARGTAEALRERAVDRLYVSERLLRTEPLEVELAVREALAQDADVECVGLAAADRLEAVGGGIAARLRFRPAHEQTSAAAERL